MTNEIVAFAQAQARRGGAATNDGTNSQRRLAAILAADVVGYSRLSHPEISLQRLSELNAVQRAEFHPDPQTPPPALRAGAAW